MLPATSTFSAFLRAVAGATICASLLATRVLAQPSSSSAPTRVAPWAAINAVGYGGAGLAIGVAALTQSASGYGGDALTAAVFMGGGVVGGFALGRRASAQLRARRPIGRWHQVGVSSGAVLAGGVLGAIAAVPLINSDGEGTALGTDEATLAKTVGVGSGVGLLFALTQQRALRANRVAVVPYHDARRAAGVRVIVQF